jgi:hypothetical protein
MSETQSATKQVTYDVSTVPVLSEKAGQLLAVAKAYRITSPVMYAASADDLKAVKAQAKVIEEARTSITVPLNAALKSVNDLFRAPAQFCTEAESVLKVAMTAYTVEEQHKEREAQAKRDEAAAAERRRLADEAAASQKLADEAAAAGDSATAEALQAQANASTNVIDLISAAPAAAPQITKVSGISMTERWSSQVDDLMELVKAVAAGTVPLEALEANTKFLDNQARALKANMKYAGVRAVMAQSISARAA